jgi:DNA-binding transcriptional ArsR family regulator
MVHLDLFQTLADPTRRLVVERRRQANDIVRQAGVHQSGVTRHLLILRNAGFVSMRADGQRRLYFASRAFSPARGVACALSRPVGSLDRFGVALDQQQKRGGAKKLEKRL